MPADNFSADFVKRELEYLSEFGPVQPAEIGQPEKVNWKPVSAADIKALRDGLENIAKHASEPWVRGTAEALLNHQALT